MLHHRHTVNQRLLVSVMSFACCMFAHTRLQVTSQRQDINTHLYARSQCHDVMLTLIEILCDSLCSNFGFLKTGLVEYIGVLQTPIKLIVMTF